MGMQHEWGQRNEYRILVANQKERGHYEKLDVGGRITLRCSIGLAQNRSSCKL
jgi:hypothetical protein